MRKDDRPRRPDSERRLRQASRFGRVLRVLELIQGRGHYDIGELARELEAREFDSLFVCEHTHIPVSRRTPHARPPSLC